MTPEQSKLTTVASVTYIQSRIRWTVYHSKHPSLQILLHVLNYSSGQCSSLFRDAHQARHELRSRFPVLDERKLSQPKPDWFFGFPISNDYDSADRSGLSKNKELFSLAQLAYLQQKIQLCSCPLMNVGSFVDKHSKKEDWEENKQLIDDKLLCFPWAIVEIKKPGVRHADITKCYCQAANGASSCLTMLEQLTKHNKTNHTSDSVKPIVVFTFAGPDVKLWLAYTTIIEVENSWVHPWQFKHVSQ